MELQAFNPASVGVYVFIQELTHKERLILRVMSQLWVLKSTSTRPAVNNMDVERLAVTEAIMRITIQSKGEMTNMAWKTIYDDAVLEIENDLHS
jgi:hypothetical protein